MRPVNLLPDRYRRVRATGRRAGLAYVAVGALAVILLMVVGYVVTNNKVTDAKDDTAKANTEADQAQQRINQLSAYGNFTQIKQARESSVRGLADARFDWERTLREIGLLTPRGVYLTSFTAGPPGQQGTTGATGGQTAQGTGGASATGPTLTVAGCAPNYKSVATTIVRFRRLANATDVTLNSSQKAGAQGGASPSAAAPAAPAPPAAGTAGANCRISWQAVVTFSAPTSQATPKRAAPRLGGGA